MSEAATTSDITLDDVLAGARAIVNHKTSRGAIGAAVQIVHAMAHTVCGLDDVARLAAEVFAMRERIAAVGAGRVLFTSERFRIEQRPEDLIARHAELEAELADALAALGYLTLVAQENANERAD